MNKYTNQIKNKIKEFKFKSLIFWLIALAPIILSSFMIYNPSFSAWTNSMMLVCLYSILFSFYYYFNVDNFSKKTNLVTSIVFLLGAVTFFLLPLFSDLKYSLFIFGKGIQEWTSASTLFLFISFIVYFNTSGKLRYYALISSLTAFAYTLINFFLIKYNFAIAQYTGYLNIPMVSFSKINNFVFIFVCVVLIGTLLSYFFEKKNFRVVHTKLSEKFLGIVFIIISLLWILSWTQRVVAANYFKKASDAAAVSDLKNTYTYLDKAISVADFDSYYLAKIDVANVEIQNINNSKISKEEKDVQNKNLVLSQIENAKKAIAYDNSEAQNHLALARSYERYVAFDKEAGYAKALEVYENIKNITTEKDVVDTMKSRLSFGIGDEQKGLGYLESAIKINPSSFSALYTYSQYFSAKKDNKSAIEYAEKAVSSSPYSFEARTNLAFLYMQESRYKDSALQWYASSQINQNSPEALYYLAFTLIKSGAYTDADKVLSVLEKSFPDAKELLSLRNSLIEASSKESSNTKTSPTVKK